MFDYIDNAEVEKARIIDFYLLFPFRMSDITFKRSDQRCKKTAISYENRRGYAIQPAPRGLFDSMKPVYEAAVQTMAAEEYLAPAALLAGVLSRTSKPIPPDLVTRISADNAVEGDLLECLGTLFEYELLGTDGLKARTRLMEHRNDAA